MDNKCFNLIDKLYEKKELSRDELIYLIDNNSDDVLKYLQEKSIFVKEENFKKKVYIRGLIEISNYCKNDCFYCGIRNSNFNICRYRLTKEDILGACDIGYSLGFRTFVLQGGEDFGFHDDLIVDTVKSIKNEYNDCAVTLSVGERDFATYERFFKAGASRYLLRHETITQSHYKKLHPKNMNLDNRIQCLYNLKKIGFQTGAGFMVGSPFQTVCNLADDLLFLKEFQPQMIGIGPFISHKDTPFRNEKDGSVPMTLLLIGIIRLMLPKSLIPSTTALGTIGENGRENGILMGANVVMPNLTPNNKSKLYNLYDNKLYTGAEDGKNLETLKNKIKSIGQEIVIDRGDY